MIIVYVVKFLAKPKDGREITPKGRQNKPTGGISPTLKDILQKFDIEIPETVAKPEAQAQPQYMSDPYKDVDEAHEKEWEHKYHEEEENDEFEVDLLGKRVQKKEYFSYDAQAIKYNAATDSRSKIHTHEHEEDENYIKAEIKPLFDEGEIENYDWQKAIVINEILNEKKWES